MKWDSCDGYVLCDLKKTALIKWTVSFEQALFIQSVSKKSVFK
jgi:hypothetical protein